MLNLLKDRQEYPNVVCAGVPLDLRNLLLYQVVTMEKVRTYVEKGETSLVLLQRRYHSH
jgi:hypothetical protein